MQDLVPLDDVAKINLIKQGLQVEKGTLVIPFSAETKQGREEIWSVIEGFLDAE